MRKLMPLIGLALVGCGGIDPGKNSDPVEISGRITLAGGQPVSDVTLNLQPTGTGTQATLPVKNGEFKGTVTPGKYTYYFSEGPKGVKPAGFQVIPEKYRAGAMDRQIEIKAGSPLVLNLE